MHGHEDLAQLDDADRLRARAGILRRRTIAGVRPAVFGRLAEDHRVERSTAVVPDCLCGSGAWMAVGGAGRRAAGR